MTLNEHISNGTPWVFYWVMWMGIVNFAAVLFLLRWKDGGIRLGHIEAFVILAAIVTAGISMEWLFEQVGYVRLLGIIHVIIWTPLVIYLWKRLAHHPRGTVFGTYLRVLIATLFVSLAFDYVDVARHLMGDGALT